MTGGAGFTRHMIDSYGNNRKLLKGEKAYKNFDKNSYSASVGKPPAFKKATPAYMYKLRLQIMQTNQSEHRKKLVAIFVSVGLLAVLLLSFIIYVF